MYPTTKQKHYILMYTLFTSCLCLSRYV